LTINLQNSPNCSEANSAEINRKIPELTKMAINPVGYDELSALIPIMGPSILGCWPKGISHQSPWGIVTF
jgi:hypothetical protein